MEPTVKKEDGRYALSMGQVTAAYKKVRSNKGEDTDMAKREQSV